MVDYAQLRKKFPVKKKRTVSHKAEIEAVRREFAEKKAALNGLKAPLMKKGVVFYAVIIIGLLMVGSLVLSATGKGGRPQISKALLQAHKSVDALAVALGRYRYHVGEYPTTEQGLAFLASDKVRKPGWNGPYIRHLVKDPWGEDYVYVSNGNNMMPTLYSKGADRTAGTTDDILPKPELFDEPFRDTSWTREWMPYRYRGYVLADDEESKEAIEKQVKVLQKEAAAADDARHNVKRPDNASILAAALAQHAALQAKELTRPVRLLTDWTREGAEGAAVTVACETRGDGALLYLNNELRGAPAVTNLPRLEWSIPYEPGELKVIAYAGGSPIGEDAVRTASAVRELVLAADIPAMAAGACQFVEVIAVDEAGVRRPDYDAEVTFSLEGAGEIVAAGACTATGEGLAFGATKTRMSKGRARVLIRRGEGTGKPLELKAASGKLRPAKLTIPWQS